MDYVSKYVLKIIDYMNLKNLLATEIFRMNSLIWIENIQRTVILENISKIYVEQC